MARAMGALGRWHDQAPEGRKRTARRCLSPGRGYRHSVWRGQRSASSAKIMPDPLREKRVELILQQLEELPTLPAVAIRVLEATSADDTSARDVVALIASDQSLTT